MPPNQYWYCCIAIFVLFSSTMCSNLLVVSMTFQRFYSIVRSHKAASFNTVKRAKITIACIVIFSFIFHSPHLFATYFRGKYCIPYAKILDKMSGQFYYWLTFVLNFIIPFVSLVIMNTVPSETTEGYCSLLRTIPSHQPGKSLHRVISQFMVVVEICSISS